VDRTPIGDFHQPRPRGFGHVARDGDVSGDLADIAFLGLAIRTVLGVDPVVRKPDGASAMRDAAKMSMPQVKQCANTANARGPGGESSRAANWAPVAPGNSIFRDPIMAY
jgi:hypothetical protein